MSRHKSSYTFNRDALLVNIIRNRKGSKNVISAKEIAAILSKSGYKTTEGYIHTLVKKVMHESNLPICSLESKGYYWGVTRQDICEGVRTLQNKINSLQERIDILNSFINE